MLREVQLIAPNRIDALEALITEASQQATMKVDSDEMDTIDFNYAQVMSKLVKAQGKLDAIITAVTDQYLMLNEDE